MRANAGSVCAWLDRSIAPLGTLCLVLGVGAGLLRGGPLADYLIATGVLFRLVAWLSDWWEPTTATPRMPRRATRIRPDTGWIPR